MLLSQVASKKQDESSLKTENVEALFVYNEGMNSTLVFLGLVSCASLVRHYLVFIS